MRLLLILIVLTSCSGMRRIDQSRLNHQAMDFENALTPGGRSFLTNLDKYNSRSGGGACTTCAH